jgi:hypothetical protein
MPTFDELQDRYGGENFRNRRDPVRGGRGHGPAACRVGGAEKLLRRKVSALDDCDGSTRRSECPAADVFRDERLRGSYGRKAA